MKKYLILLIPFIIISGCKKKNEFTVSGVVNNKQKESIYIYGIDIDKSILLDSSRINKKGTFKFKIKASIPDFYQVTTSNSDFITILAEPGENINLVLDGKNISGNYSVSGSEGSELIKMIDLKLLETKKKLDSLTTVYDKAATEPGFEVKGPAIEKEYINIINDQHKYSIKFIINNVNSLAIIKALYQKYDDDKYVLNSVRDLQYMKIASDSLMRHYPNSKQVKALVKDFGNELEKVYSQKLQDLAKIAPETTLNPNLADINGKRISLSSLKGKYVLLTFWSATSQDCVSDNLALKNIYKAFHNKGFEIYQINVDKDEALWKKAVAFDELPWISTREEDPNKPMTAMIYNVQSLPANYLYDKEGEIIASNIYGNNLKTKLEQLLGN